MGLVALRHLVQFLEHVANLVVALALGYRKLHRNCHRYYHARRKTEFKGADLLHVLQLVVIPSLLAEDERREVNVCIFTVGRRRRAASLHVDVKENLHDVPVLLVHLRDELVELLVNYLQASAIRFHGLLVDWA